VRPWPDELIICILFDSVGNQAQCAAQNEYGYRSFRIQLQCPRGRNQSEIQIWMYTGGLYAACTHRLADSRERCSRRRRRSGLVGC
jgi:hypothetical protein